MMPIQHSQKWLKAIQINTKRQRYNIQYRIKIYTQDIFKTLTPSNKTLHFLQAEISICLIKLPSKFDFIKTHLDERISKQCPLNDLPKKNGGNDIVQIEIIQNVFIIALEKYIHLFLNIRFIFLIGDS